MSNNNENQIILNELMSNNNENQIILNGLMSNNNENQDSEMSTSIYIYMCEF